MEAERTNQLGSGRGTSVTPRVVFGLLVLTLGVLFLLDNMAMISIEDYWRYWPVFLIALGLAKLLQPCGRLFGFVLFAVGTWALLDTLNVLEFQWDYLWPAVLILVGGSLVWRGLRAGSARWGPKADPSARLHAFAALGGADVKSSSTDFRGGDATAIMGGCEIDLRQATPASDGAVLDTFAVWGGIDIKVPSDWTVAVQGLPLLGGFSDARRNPRPDPAKRLVVKGVAIMGGVEVKD